MTVIPDIWETEIRSITNSRPAHTLSQKLNIKGWDEWEGLG
jgi:hypothetical protein